MDKDARTVKSETDLKNLHFKLRKVARSRFFNNGLLHNCNQEETKKHEDDLFSCIESAFDKIQEKFEESQKKQELRNKCHEAVDKVVRVYDTDMRAELKKMAKRSDEGRVKLEDARREHMLMVKVCLETLKADLPEDVPLIHCC